MRFESAKNYDEFAVAQKQAARDLYHALFQYVKRADRIYEIGCGSGIFTHYLLRHFAFRQLFLNDLYRCPLMERYPSQIGDVCEQEIPSNLDLVVSSYVFQWIIPLEELFKKIAAALKQNGFFAFSMFVAGTLWELESFTHQGLPYKTPQQIKEILFRHFDIVEWKENFCTLSFPDCFALLHSLKQTGVNNLQGDFRLTKTSYRKLDESFDGKYELTYRYGVFVARKK